jgi:hypothetical protein
LFLRGLRGNEGLGLDAVERGEIGIEKDLVSAHRDHEGGDGIGFGHGKNQDDVLGQESVDRDNVYLFGFREYVLCMPQACAAPMIAVFQFICGALFGGVIGVGIWATSGFGGSGYVGCVIITYFAGR